MNKHQKLIAQISDYVDGLLPKKERAELETHLAECEACQQMLDNLRQVKQKLNNMPAAELPPDVKVGLYETLNQKLAQDGKGQMTIPAELLAQAKAKSQAAGQAARDVAVTGAQAAADTVKSRANIAKTMGTGMAGVVGQTAKAMATPVKHAGKMAKEAVDTAVDSGRIATQETAQVMREATDSPLKAAATPARLAGKAAKTGARMAKGSAKIAATGVKGGLKTAQESAKIVTTAAKKGGQTAKAMADSAAASAQGHQAVKDAVKKGIESIKEAGTQTDATEQEPAA
ncbi:MAG: zf-HC2 domain-containing protein [Ardenticatenaceae bacterium]|nr:zf-HC2 domain-containing protein [Anaerolineales bacterium]MCB8920886.1 zf-HC2 domain-containing protein [Ardenticatenaceae bacterium]